MACDQARYLGRQQEKLLSTCRWALKLSREGVATGIASVRQISAADRMPEIPFCSIYEILFADFVFGNRITRKPRSADTGRRNRPSRQTSTNFKLSQPVTGLKSVWLGVLNPFFRDGSSGSVLPVRITGLRSNPDFGLELRRHDKPAQTKRMALR
jgi:hypothetical protein